MPQLFGAPDRPAGVLETLCPGSWRLNLRPLGPVKSIKYVEWWHEDLTGRVVRAKVNRDAEFW